MPLPSSPPKHDDPHQRWCTFTGPGHELPAKPDTLDETTPTLEALNEAEGATSAVAEKVETLVSSCPAHTKHALEIRVVDDEERPLLDQRVELRRSDSEAMATRTDATGLARFEGLDAGSYQLALIEVDEGGWELEGGEALPARLDRSTSVARWRPPRAASTETVEYTVSDGECLSTLAYRHGWSAEALWKHNADLAKIRDSKNVLAPGDVVKIPPIRVGFQTVNAGHEYRARRARVLEELRLQFLADEDVPRAGEKYLLEIVSDGGEEERAGATDGTGTLIELVPSSTREVRVTLGEGDRCEHHVFRAAHIDPVDTVAGIQSRLLNLDFEIDEERGVLGPITARSLAAFQRERGLEITGQPDVATCAALVKQHGS